jgi:glycosyltransferase involved in cell wall biosynthesis
MATAEQKIRIAIIVPRLEALGPVIVMQNLVNALYDNEDFSIKVFYLDGKVDNNIKISVPVERLKPGRFIFNDYDIIHTNGIRADLFAYLNRKKIKYHISTIHNFVFEDLLYTYNSLFSWIFGNIWLILWKRADKLVCVSDAMKDYYDNWFSSSKLEAIHNGIPETDNHYRPDADVIQSIDKFHSKGLKLLGFAGMLTKRKGIDQVLHLIAAETSLAAMIIGDGKEITNLKRLSEKLHISDRCKFCGFRSSAVVYFKYFDFFIMPSRSEGFGLALIEAVQQKVPVICSDNEVFRELFTADEVTFFKLDDLGSLSGSVKTTLETGDKKSEIAYERYSQNYSALTMAKHYQRLYKSPSVIRVA